MATTMTNELAEKIISTSAADQSLCGRDIAEIVGWEGSPNRLVSRARDFLANTPDSKAKTFRRLAMELGIELTADQEAELPCSS